MQNRRWGTSSLRYETERTRETITILSSREIGQTARYLTVGRGLESGCAYNHTNAMSDNVMRYATIICTMLEPLVRQRASDSEIGQLNQPATTRRRDCQSCGVEPLSAFVLPALRSSSS